MFKKMKKLILTVILIFVFAIPASAADSAYSELYNSSDFSSAESALPKQAKDFFSDNNISLSDEQWYKQLNNVNVYSVVLSVFREGAQQVLSGGAEIVAIILLSAVFDCFSQENGTNREAVGLVFSVVLSASVIKNILLLLKATASAIKSVSTFMLAAVPVYAGLEVLSGRAGTGTVSTAIILAVAEAISYAAGFVVVPLMSCYAAVSVSAGVSPLLHNSGLAESIKKTAMWVLTFTFTAFMCVLSVQSTINAAADSVGLRTAKFLVGSLVPVAGTALSESISAVTGAVGLLKSSVGIYIVIAVAITILPLVVELTLWRLSLNICAALDGLFSVKKASAVIKGLDSVLAVLLGAALFVAAVFIIALAIVLKSGG